MVNSLSVSIFFIGQKDKVNVNEWMWLFEHDKINVGGDLYLRGYPQRHTISWVSVVRKDNTREATLG